MYTLTKWPWGVGEVVGEVKGGEGVGGGREVGSQPSLACTFIAWVAHIYVN
jgi:hypothetical protein